MLRNKRNENRKLSVFPGFQNWGFQIQVQNWWLKPKNRKAEFWFTVTGPLLCLPKKWLNNPKRNPPFLFFSNIENFSTYEGNWLCRNVCHSGNWCHLPHTESHFVLVQTSIWDIKWHFPVNILEIYLLCHEWEPSFIKTPYRIWQYGLSSFNFNS